MNQGDPGSGSNMNNGGGPNPGSPPPSNETSTGAAGGLAQSTTHADESNTNPPSYKANPSMPPSYNGGQGYGYNTGLDEGLLNRTPSDQPQGLTRSPRLNDLSSIYRSSGLVNSESCPFPEGSRENHTPVSNSYSEGHFGNRR